MLKKTQAASSEQNLERISNLTKVAFLWTRLLGVPFWALMGLLSFILYKDLHISHFQITAIVTIKPMSALLAPYLSQAIHQRPDRFVANMLWINALRFIPFLLVPWFHSAWYIILSFGSYMTLSRAVVPGWLETFKCNLPELKRERIVGHGSTIDFCGAALFGFAIGVLLDSYPQVWIFLFPILALLGISSNGILCRLPPPKITSLQPNLDFKLNIKGKLLKPWKQSWKLLRERSDFANYHIGFMLLGGAGIMIMQPVLPAFFVDTLNLSYKDMSFAMAVCKGIGFALASPFFTRLFPKLHIHYFSGLVILLGFVFPIFLISAKFNVSFVYLAYLIYGIMQSGSELSWQMSGIVFARDKNSSAYSATNILAVGMRGCIIPALGAILLLFTNAPVVMLLGGLLCLLSSIYLIRRLKLVSEIKT